MEYIYLDGEYVSPERLESSVALQTEAGVFETIRIKQNSPEYLKPHLTRLSKGARFIGLIPPAVDYESLIRELLKKNSLSGELARLRIILFLGEERETAHLCLMLEPYNPPARDNYANGVKLSAARHPFDENDIAKIKSTCRLPYSRLREKATGEGNFDCLLTNADGEILETTIGNLWVWDRNQFAIPPVDSNRLLGIMEKTVVRNLKRKGFSVSEKSMSLKELNSKKGVLMTNSLIGVLPVRAVGDTVLKNVTGEEIIRVVSS
jgi:branched-subunit amino acid aminotransferase/4-amino-4-deoxychorismate lyase